MAFHVSKVEKDIKDNKIYLPLGFSKEEESKTITAVACVVNQDNLKWVALYDENTTESSTSDKGQEVYIDDLLVEGDTLHLTQRVKDFLGIKKKVVMVGIGDYYELWHPDTYQKWKQAQPKEDHSQSD